MKLITRKKNSKLTIVVLLFLAFLITCGVNNKDAIQTASAHNFSAVAIGNTKRALIITAPTPRLDSVNNFRDIAIGDNPTPYRGTNGRLLRQGVIYRSNALTPSAVDLATLNTLDIGAVYDLRTPAEIAGQPDVLPTGATYTNVNILDSASPPTPTGITSPEKTIAFMESLNRDLVTDENQRAKLAELLKKLAASDNVLLFHCTSGKDRTGWVTAVLLSLAGVPKDVIIHDYLLTNTYMASTISTIYESLLVNQGKNVADIYFPALGVKESFVEASFNQVLMSYGSMDNYITYGLKLDAAIQTKLRHKLLS